MAIDLFDTYPTKTNAPSPAWPFGQPRNITTPGDGTGTPWEQAIIRDTEGFKQALLTAGGLTPSGTPDTAEISQYLQALYKISGATVNTITQMQDLVGVNNLTVVIVGNSSDIGNGRYIYVYLSSSTDTADGVFVVSPTSGIGRYILISDRFKQAGTGALDRVAQDKQRDLVTTDDFISPSATGNQASAVQNILTYAPSAPYVHMKRRSWRVDTERTVSAGTHLIKGTFDFSQAASGATLFRGQGSVVGGSAQSLTANAARLTFTVTVASTTGYSVGEWVRVRSNANYAVNGGDAPTQGEFKRVVSVTATQLGFSEPLQAAYNTADSALVERINWLDDVVFEDLTLIGRGNGTLAGAFNQYGIRLAFAKRVRFRGKCRFMGFDYDAIELSSCLDVEFEDGCEFLDAYDDTAGQDGESYGIALINGCQDVTIRSPYGRNLRHLVAIGGTQGVNRNIQVFGATGDEFRAAALDSHAGAENVDFLDFNVSVSRGWLNSGSQNGIQYQGGGSFNCRGVVRGMVETAVAVQTFGRSAEIDITVKAVDTTATSGALGTSGTDGNAVGVLVESRSSTGITRLDIHNSNIPDNIGRGVLVHAVDGPIRNVRVAENVTGQNKVRCIYLQSDASRVIENINIEGNIGRVLSGGSECIMLDGNAAADVEFGTVNGNTMFGGTYGVRGVNTDRITTDGNTLTSWTTSAITVAGANSVTGDNATT